MEPVFGFIVYAIGLVIVGVVAAKRGQMWGLYVLACPVLSFIMVRLVAGAGGTGVGAAFAGLAVLAGALLVSLSTATSEAAAVAKGESGEYKKCPFCAEAIRREAIKCKHCGSEVSPVRSAA